MDEETRRALADLRGFACGPLAQPHPGENAQRLNELRAIVFRVSSDDPYVIEKKSKLMSRAEAWFSPRRWATYHISPEALHVDMLSLIDSICEQLERSDRHR